MVTTNGGPARLLLQSRPPGESLADIALMHSTNNRFAVGARVGVERAGQPTLWRRVHTDGSYLSASDIRTHVGLGPTSPGSQAIVVQWPDGQRDRWPDAGSDRIVAITREPVLA